MENNQETAMAKNHEEIEKKMSEEEELSPVQKRNILIYKVLKQICITGIWFAMVSCLASVI